MSASHEENVMSIYPILSALLTYPEQPLLDALPEIERALDAQPGARAALAPLVESLRATPLIELQERYVATFDRTPSHSLHLFEHVHGESRDRGQAMVDLLDEYRRHGFEPVGNELPDYVPLFVEFLGAIAGDGDGDGAHAAHLLGDAIEVLAALGERLARAQSPYAGAFDVLRACSPVEPRPVAEPPPRTMDEALERFGPGPDGVEPLLSPAADASLAQPIRFHPPRRAATPAPRA
ncbi:nitrate reductase molybdenum cofactor assembly chaperone [Burkholderia pseudomallei]|uniref:nitrate reductase molybdenum cofactor assembly chaperone n=1 Tax=Burkholderia pseudomallei TaxID=28450 RepID=UPI00067DC973|nr:nitrate reductase molybdenum cofactor assembly chaperone [Burkholderia pseudomallei]MBY7651251.1 nitrate reductase molybdenum cofactor assembly chaperone [Burkholderia pseudomallei]MDS1025555.1 nitrate reductase molybdenum cofactor assembly chaperone [Burkholderia pseudomallei]QUN81904.1 nitrate reductase molybdenum cofactor assembly chaperone [Burkholderia pseudomallei]QUN87827.1 nitrate reductase molybdenum cofactor assembly chaperone [Burkholderia pseudomallei]QUN93748.1 nitrate reductas